MAHAVERKDAFESWRARGPAQVHQALLEVYPNSEKLALIGAREASHFSCSRLHLSTLTVLCSGTSGYRCRAAPNDAVRVTLPARVGVVVTAGREQTVALAGRSGLSCAQEVIEREVRPGYFGFHFQIPRQTLLSAAQTLTGQRHRLVENPISIDLQSPVGGSLFRTVAGLLAESQRLATAGLGRLAVASANELIVHLTAAAVLPGVQASLAQSPSGASADCIDRARQYIDAHAGEPIRLGELAHSLGISLRTLQHGFQKRFGCSPSEHLFRCRLDLARARLLAASDTTTVTQIAVECGFVNVGAFANRYFRAFGELPSQTLQHANASASTPAPDLGRARLRGGRRARH